MKKLLILLTIMFLASCGKSVVSESTRDFPDNRWDKTDPKTFEFEIEKDIVSGRLVLEFGHIFEPLYNRVPLRITVVNPAGEEEIISTDMMLDDENGEHLSDCSGDICDFEQIVKNNTPFLKGNYKIIISHNFPTEYVPNVLRMGVKVEDILND